MSTIEWTGKTWNPVVGCTKVSEGCRNCYAEKMSRRMAAIADDTVNRGLPPTVKMNAYTRVVKYKNDYPLAQWSNRVVCIEESLKIPMEVRKPTTWFVNSMSDLFHPDVPFDFIDKIFDTMAQCQQHRFQILTKRPERMAEYAYGINTNLIWHDQPWPLPNVWLGTSVENQETADERIPHLLKCPAAVRFLSCEPLLDPIPRLPLNGIGLAIVGGESGPGARPFNLDWARSIREQCGAAGVPFYMKQLGAKPHDGLFNYTPDADEYGAPSFRERWLKLKSRKGNDMDEWPADLRVREMPDVKKSKGGE